MIIFSPKDSAYGAACWSLQRRKSICDVTGNSMAEPCDSCWSCNSLLFLLVMSYCQLGYPGFRLGLLLLTIAEMQASNSYVEGQEGSGFWLTKVDFDSLFPSTQLADHSSHLVSLLSLNMLFPTPVTVLFFILPTFSGLWPLIHHGYPDTIWFWCFTSGRNGWMDTFAPAVQLQNEWSVKTITGRSHVACITFCSSSLDVCWECGWW